MVTPTVGYGLRLIESLRHARRSLDASSGESLRELHVATLELAAKVLWCSVEGAAVDLWALLEAWLAGSDKPGLPTGSAVCQRFEAQAQAVYDAAAGGIERLDHLLDHRTELIEAGAEVVTYLYDLFTALGLGDHYGTAVRDPGKLGAFIGVLAGEIGMLIAPAFLGGRAAPGR